VEVSDEDVHSLPVDLQEAGVGACRCRGGGGGRLRVVARRRLGSEIETAGRDWAGGDHVEQSSREAAAMQQQLRARGSSRRRVRLSRE
jgi:hypothetical protein